MNHLSREMTEDVEKKVKFMKIAFFILILIQKKNLCQTLKKKDP